MMNTLPAEFSGPTRPLGLFAVAVTGVMASAALGAMTNAVAGSVSPNYFVTVLRWQEVRNVQRAAIAQGIFEGLLFGVAFALVFTAGTGLITRASCGYWFAVKHLLGVVVGALIGWVLGGLCAMGLAALSPEFYHQTIRSAPADFASLLRFAWVGGSIVGLQLGGFVSLVLALVVLRANWRRGQDAASLANS